MKMKYYRFLYGETAGCLMHFGELNDTLTKEHVAFLYLSGVRGNEYGMESENSLFLYPDHLDLVVLSDMSRNTTDELKRILAKTVIDTLLIPRIAPNYGGYPEGEAVESVGILERCLDEGLSSVGQVISVGTEADDSFDLTVCGWKFYAKCSRENELMLLHAMTQSGFDDMVMNVKYMHESRACLVNCAPDEYGCALGCTIRRDYHECKYHRSDESGIVCRTGTLLMGTGTDTVCKKSMQSNAEVNTESKVLLLNENANALSDPESKALLHENGDEDLMNALFMDSGIMEDEIRFFGFSGDAWRLAGRRLSLAEKECISETKYFIGTDSGMDDAAIAEVCRFGGNRIPVVLKNGQGICCSGFFKYEEINRRVNVG